MKRDTLLFLQDIVKAVESIFDFIAGYDYNSFTGDDKTFSAVIRKFEIMGEAVKNLPDDIINNNPEIPWSYMKKMRDRLSHGYFDTDPEIIWETINTNLKEIPPVIKKIIKASKKPPE